LPALEKNRGQATKDKGGGNHFPLRGGGFGSSDFFGLSRLFGSTNERDKPELRTSLTASESASPHIWVPQDGHCPRCTTKAWTGLIWKS